MFIRIFEDDLLVRKIELRKGEEYRIGSDNQCEIRLEGISALEGVLYESDGKWLFRKVKDKEGIEVYPGYELVFGNYHLRFAAPVFGGKDEAERTIVYQMNDATIVINKQNNPRLVFLDGEFKGKEVEIDKPIFTIGRIAGNDLVIPDPGVSKRHCRIMRKGEKFYIEDFGSTNGTYINGEKVEKGELKSGDMLDIGPAKLQFWMGEKLYKPGKKFFSGEKTTVKTKGSNKRIVILMILILLAAGVLFLPTESNKKPAPPVDGKINLSTTINVTSDNPLSTPSPLSPQESARSPAQPAEVKEEKAPTPEQQHTQEAGTRKTPPQKPVKSRSVKKKRTPMLVKRRMTIKKVQRSYSRWWVNKPCSYIWNNLEEERKDFTLFPDLRGKVRKCAEVEIQDYLDKKDFAGAMKIYATAQFISGGKLGSLATLFDKAVKEMYRQAYLLEDVDPDTAKKIYQRIVKITPPESLYHQKAANRLH